MPKSVKVACNSAATAIHMLSGVSGWGSQGRETKTHTMTVRLNYADGKVEDHKLLDGVHFADYIRRIDVPGSKFAFKLRGQQLRYLVVRPKHKETIATIELIKGTDRSAPIVAAMTLEAP